MADLMQKAREQFEAWASAKGMPTHRRDFPSSERRGEYGNAYTQDCWEAWYAAALRAAPEGYVLVPVEPTPEMLMAAGSAVHSATYWKTAWAAMLAARPQGVKDA